MINDLKITTNEIKEINKFLDIKNSNSLYRDDNTGYWFRINSFDFIGNTYNFYLENIENESKNKNSNNNGGSTDYYKLPNNAKDLQDLIELKEMNFSQGNIFKAIYRANENHHSTYERDLNKIIWFANRELERIGNIRADLEIIGH